jgi:LTXXQ motif family protein
MISNRRVTRRVTWMASLALVLAAMALPAQAQGPGMGMGHGMMGRHGMMGHMCGPGTAGMSPWRINRLERLIRPTDAQRTKFDEFKAAADKAAQSMRAACPTERPRTMTQHLDVMEKHAAAMLESVKTVRPSLDALYASLSDEQKTRLDSGMTRGRFWRGHDRR